MGFLWFKTKKEKEIEKRLELEAITQAVVEGVKALLGEAPIYEKPYKKRLMSNNTLTVVLHNGESLTKSGATIEDYDAVGAAKDEIDVRVVMIPSKLEDADLNRVQQIKENVETARGLKVLDTHEDFERKDGGYYLKDVPLSIPEVILKAFIEVLDEPENYKALKNFWYWLSTNPNPEAIKDAYRFIERNDVKITPLGLLVLYRSIVSVDENKSSYEDKRRIEEISRLYVKVKKAKKGIANYDVWEEDGEYKAIPNTKGLDYGKRVGNLKELYASLPSEQGNLFTDSYSGKMEIKLGSVYKIDEEEVDRNNQIECSRGLHVGSRNFSINSFGDTQVMALVNPSKIRAVPEYDSYKMRVSEMFIAASLRDENGKYLDEDVDLVPFDEEYFNISVEELKNMAKNSDIKELEVNRIVPVVGLNTIESIALKLEEGRKAISERIKTIA